MGVYYRRKTKLSYGFKRVYTKQEGYLIIIKLKKADSPLLAYQAMSYSLDAVILFSLIVLVIWNSSLFSHPYVVLSSVL
jgi:hypothetical protein